MSQTILSSSSLDFIAFVLSGQQVQLMGLVYRLILDFVAKESYFSNSTLNLLAHVCTTYFNSDHFQAEDEEGEAEDDELDADAEDKENIESKAGSSQPNKRKRDNEDDAKGDK